MTFDSNVASESANVLLAADALSDSSLTFMRDHFGKWSVALRKSDATDDMAEMMRAVWALLAKVEDMRNRRAYDVRQMDRMVFGPRN